MKKILAVLLMLPVIALSADEKYTVKKVDSFCLTSKGLINLVESSGERPILTLITIRNDKPVPAVLYVNAETKTWSLVEKIGEEFCITSFGGNFNVLSSRDKLTI